MFGAWEFRVYEFRAYAFGVLGFRVYELRVWGLDVWGFQGFRGLGPGFGGVLGLWLQGFKGLVEPGFCGVKSSQE